MGSDGDVVILADDIDILVGRMGNDIDLGISDEEVRHDIAHRELHGGHCRGAAHCAARFDQPMANGGLGQFGLA
jgi:hypothetical protein